MKALGILFLGAGGGGGAVEALALLLTNAVAAGWPGNLNYAEGGYVTGPTDALIGEGGYGEYVLLLLDAAMSRYSSGKRVKHDGTGRKTAKAVSLWLKR